MTSTCQDADGDWVGLGYLRSRLEGAQIQLEGKARGVTNALFHGAISLLAVNGKTGRNLLHMNTSKR